MSYEKHPTFACGDCHKTFKNERALRTHNDAVHAEKPVQEAQDGLATGMDSNHAGWWRDIIPDGDERN